MRDYLLFTQRGMRVSTGIAFIAFHCTEKTRMVSFFSLKSHGSVRAVTQSSSMMPAIESKYNLAHESLICCSACVAFDFQIFSVHLRRDVLGTKAVLFFASLTFLRWKLPRWTPGTNLSLGDKLQEPLYQLCKQSGMLYWDFGFNLKQQKFKRETSQLQHPTPSSQINCSLPPPYDGPTLWGCFGTSPHHQSQHWMWKSESVEQRIMPKRFYHYYTGEEPLFLFLKPDVGCRLALQMPEAAFDFLCISEKSLIPF